MKLVAEKLGIDVWSLRNGMALCKPLERAFDNSEICFFEDNTGNLVLHILEPKLRDLKVRRLPVLMNSCAASSHTAGRHGSPAATQGKQGKHLKQLVLQGCVAEHNFISISLHCLPSFSLGTRSTSTPKTRQHGPLRTATSQSSRLLTWKAITCRCLQSRLTDRTSGEFRKAWVGKLLQVAMVFGE